MLAAAHKQNEVKNWGLCRPSPTHLNLVVDMSARTAELGRCPTARQFLLKYADRILFGTDLLPDVEMYRLHYRFLETADEYFEYPSHASRQGRWNIYGLNLPPDVLQKTYRENALRMLKGAGLR
jgi:predicted TIM-barrel fold metal-dependent hydrolase